VLEDLLGGLSGQLREEFPAVLGIGTRVAELVVDLGEGESPGDSTIAAGIPLMQQIPQCPSCMTLPIKCPYLRRARIQPALWVRRQYIELVFESEASWAVRSR
jgi:hypothetical protein